MDRRIVFLVACNTGAVYTAEVGLGLVIDGDVRYAGSHQYLTLPIPQLNPVGAL